MASERQTGDFGAKLREARERRGLSLRVIADTTKISVGFLEALEKNDIARLPGGIFSRAFVRAYADQVGLDPEQTIAEFITRFPVETVTQGHPRTRASAIVDELEADARRTGWSPLTKTALVAVPAIALAAYFAVVGRQAALAPVQTVVAAAPQAVAARTTSPTLEIALQAVRATTVTVALDSGPATTIAIESGSIRSLAAAGEMVIVPADPLALQWFVNGRPARPMNGEVRVTTATAQTFLAVQ